MRILKIILYLFKETTTKVQKTEENSLAVRAEILLKKLQEKLNKLRKQANKINAEGFTLKQETKKENTISFFTEATTTMTNKYNNDKSIERLLTSENTGIPSSTKNSYARVINYNNNPTTKFNEISKKIDISEESFNNDEKVDNKINKDLNSFIKTTVFSTSSSPIEEDTSNENKRLEITTQSTEDLITVLNELVSSLKTTTHIDAFTHMDPIRTTETRSIDEKINANETKSSERNTTTAENEFVESLTKNKG